MVSAKRILVLGGGFAGLWSAVARPVSSTTSAGARMRWMSPW